mmetsp:Transcript_24029/g.47730  ORF Transcript_24029/g.47730 Transcript_24029/m.47730 type:complete len:80 (-) Transcript_24029:478-717(-)
MGWIVPLSAVVSNDVEELLYMSIDGFSKGVEASLVVEASLIGKLNELFVLKDEDLSLLADDLFIEDDEVNMPLATVGDA